MQAVGESVAIPLRYYENNISGTVNLLQLMEEFKCPRIVFSSSATVYGDAAPPVAEDNPTSATNAYGRTKLFIEGILGDVGMCSRRLLINLCHEPHPCTYIRIAIRHSQVKDRRPMEDCCT